MADRYCSSVAWSAVAVFAITTAYSVGDLIRQLATPTVGNERVFRCTTAGTTAGSEPSWNLTKGATTSSGTATFTEVTGDSARQQNGGVTNTWTAPHARLENMLAWMSAGDRGFVSSDHTQTNAGSVTLTSPGNTSQMISVNRTTGNIPPLAADRTSGATCISALSSASFTHAGGGTWDGFTFTFGSGTTTGGVFSIGSGANTAYDYISCTFTCGSTGASNTYSTGNSTANHVRFDGCTMSFGATSNNNQIQGKIYYNNHTFSGSVPAAGYFRCLTGEFYVHASDFSTLSSGSLFSADSNSGICSVKLVNCKLHASLTVAAITAATNDTYKIDAINVNSGAVNYDNRWYKQTGTVTTESTITLTSGASDGVQAVSHKGVSASITNKVAPLEFPEYWVWNSDTGSSKTATIEIQSSATLTNDDIWMELEYLSASGSPLGAIGSSAPTTILTAAANITTSAASWNSSVGSPALFQKMQVTFTPQMIGYVRATVKMAKASQTVYVDPRISIA